MTNKQQLYQKWFGDDKAFGVREVKRRIYEAVMVLIRYACACASRSPSAEKVSKSQINLVVIKWVDDALAQFAEPRPLEKEKCALMKAFSELLDKWAEYPVSENVEETICPVCKSQLEKVYDEPLVCSSCLQSVIDALDDLVRASTDVWTPKQFRDSYKDLLLKYPS